MAVVVQISRLGVQGLEGIARVEWVGRSSTLYKTPVRIWPTATPKEQP